MSKDEFSKRLKKEIKLIAGELEVELKEMKRLKELYDSKETYV